MGGVACSGHRETGGRTSLNPGRGEIDGHQVSWILKGANLEQYFRYHDPVEPLPRRWVVRSGKT